jgi:hypothetical protein
MDIAGRPYRNVVTITMELWVPAHFPRVAVVIHIKIVTVDIVTYMAFVGQRKRTVASIATA